MKAVRVDQIIMLMVTVIINVVALTGGGQEVSSGSEGSPVPTTYTNAKVVWDSLKSHPHVRFAACQTRR